MYICTHVMHGGSMSCMREHAMKSDVCVWGGGVHTPGVCPAISKGISRGFQATAVDWVARHSRYLEHSDTCGPLPGWCGGLSISRPIA